MAHPRPIDKEFEDADDTGILNLSGRNLRGFPLIPGELCNFSDVFEANFSKNRLDRIPEEVCAFHSLVKLNCYHNSIRFISDRLCQLTNLKELDLSRNFLQQIPAELCRMSLHSLNLSNNRLVSLPLEFGKLKQLKHLDLSCNVLPDLPPSIVHMTSLQHLDLHRNELKDLPNELFHLPITYLNVSSNSLGRLPTSLRHIDTLTTFLVADNPLESPPTQVCIRGLVHIFKYLESLEKRGSDPHLVISRDEMSSLRRRNNKLKRGPSRPISDASSMRSSSEQSLGLVDEIASQLMNSSTTSLDGQTTPTGTNSAMHWSIAQYMTTEEKHSNLSDQSKEEYREAAHRLYMQQERQKGRPKLRGLRSSSPPVMPSTAYPPPHTTDSSTHYGTLPKRKSSNEDDEAEVGAAEEVKRKGFRTGPGRSLPNETYRRSGSWNSHMRHVSPVLPSKYSTPPAERANRVEDKTEEEKEKEKQKIKQTLREAFKEKKDGGAAGGPKRSSQSATDLKVAADLPKAKSPSTTAKAKTTAAKSSSTTAKAKTTATKSPSTTPKTKAKTATATSSKSKSKAANKPPPLDTSSTDTSSSQPCPPPDSPGSDREGSITPTNELPPCVELDEPQTPTKDDKKSKDFPEPAVLEPIELEEEPVPLGKMHNSHSADDILSEQAERPRLTPVQEEGKEGRKIRPLSYTESDYSRDGEDYKQRLLSAGDTEDLSPSADGTWPRLSSPRDRKKSKDVFKFLSGGQGPNYTVHRQQFQMKRILEKNQQVKQSIEELMQITLADDMSEWVSDGVILCQVVNKLHPGTIHTIHMAPEGQELSVIHRTRNIAAFILACKALNVPQEELCSAGDIIEFKDPARVITCIQRVLDSGVRQQLTNV